MENKIIEIMNVEFDENLFEENVKTNEFDVEYEEGEDNANN